MKIKSNFKNLLCFSLSAVCYLTLSSCATKSTQTYSNTPLYIETKAQLKDLRKDENHTVNIDIALAPQKAVRLDVTALFNYKIATVLMTPEKIQYIYYNAKSFVEGPFSSKTLYPIFKQHVDPRILWKAIHGQNPSAQNLKCQTDESQRPTICQDKDLTVTWTYQEPPQKKIVLKNPQFEMIWVFKAEQPLDESRSETFVLKKPEGFKEFVIK